MKSVIERSPGSVVLLPIDKVVTSFFKMRIADRGVGELAVSIRRHGLLHPVVVRPSGRAFELVAGHRRFEACKLLGWRDVPCLVRNMSDKEAYELALTENVQRETLDPVEEAEAYRRYVEHFGWGSVSELARKIGKSEEYVSHRMLLLRLPGELLEKVRTRQLSPWKAQELVWLGDSSFIMELSESIMERKLTVRQIRDVRRRIKDGLDVGIAVREATRSGGRTRGRGYIGAFHARCLGRCVKSLRKAASILDKAIDDASVHRDARLRVFLVEKRSVVQRLIFDLCEERQKHRKPISKRATPR